MIGTLSAIYLATDLACRSGTLLGLVTDPLAWTVRRSFEGHLLTASASVSLALDHYLAADVIEGRVLQYHFVHDGTVRILELRIAGTVRDERTGRLDVTAHGVERDLVEMGRPIETTVDGAITRTLTDYDQTLSAALTARILPAAPAHIVAGTITPSTVLPVLEYNNSSPLAALLAALDREAELTGVWYDTWVEMNGSTNYLLHVGVYNGSAPVVAIDHGTNLLGYRESRDRQPLATQLWPADPLGFRRPTYVVSAVNAAWLEVRDMLGGLGPAQEADQLDGLTWVEWKNGTTHTITDTVVIDAQTTRLYMASTSGVVAGEIGYVARNASRDDLDLLTSPSRSAAWKPRGRELVVRDWRTNLAPNPKFALWGTGVPAGWTLAGSGTATQETSLVHLGATAVCLTPDSPAATYIEDVWTVHVARPTTLLLSVWVQLSEAAADGSVAVATRVGMAAYSNVAGSPWTFTGSTYVGGYVRHDMAVPLTTANVHDIRVRLGNDEGAASGHLVYFANLLFVEGTDVLDWFEGSGAALNIARGHQEFADYGDPQLSCDVDAVDLAQLARDWTDRPLDLGIQIETTAPRVGALASRLRIVDYRLSSDRPANPGLTVGTRKARLTSKL